MEVGKLTSKIALYVSALALTAVTTAAQAVPITLTSQLTGDTRSRNPDNLIVDVMINTDTTSNKAYWTVDINSLLHPNIKLGEFYFNMSGSASDYSFSGFSPSGWSISSPASVQGAGNVTFLFEALDEPPKNAADITNEVNLTFTMELTTLGSTFNSNLFLNAPIARSTDSNVGSGQLGAHLQSLVAANGESDSGFAFGSYKEGGGGGSGTPASEPATIALLGLGLLGFATTRRKPKMNKNTYVA